MLESGRIQRFKCGYWCCFTVALSVQLGALSAQETPALVLSVRVRVARPDPGCGVQGPFWCGGRDTRLCG